MPIRRKRGEARPALWSDWAAALKDIDNSVIVDFFQRELTAGRENYLRKRILRYRVNGKRRYDVVAHAKRAYVWQRGRFKDDDKFWTVKIGAQADVKPVKDGRALRFYLVSAEDFVRFSNALENDLRSVEFLDTDELPDVEVE